MGGGIEEHRVERTSDPIRLLRKSSCVVGLAEKGGHAAQDYRVVVIEAGSGQRDRRELRFAGIAGSDVVPVAKPVRHDVIRPARSEIRDVPLHAVVVASKQVGVSGPLVLLPRNDDVGAAPFGRIAEPLVENGVLGRDVRHQPGLELAVGHVAHPFLEETREIEFVSERRSVQVVLLEPPEALAMRAIGDHAHEVAALRPANERVDPVEELV
jgi:hypothetical protein